MLQNIKKLKEGPFGDIKNFRKKSLTTPKKGRESHSAKNWRRETLLGFEFQIGGFWMRQNQVLSTFGKSG